MKNGRIRFNQLSIAFIWDIIVNLAFWGICVTTIVWAIMDSDDGFTYKRWLFIPDWLMITMIVICLAISILELLVYAYHIDFENGIIKTDGHWLTAKISSAIQTKHQDNGNNRDKSDKVQLQLIKEIEFSPI